MFDVKLGVGDKGFLARLARAGKILFRGGKKVEKEITEGGLLGEKRRRVAYKTDAEESLAMALGYDVESDEILGRGLSEAMEKI